MNYTTKFFTLIALIAITELNIFSQSGWVQQNSGTTSNVTGISLINYNTGYVLASPILKTTNGGQNWIPLPGNPATSNMCWPDYNTGYLGNGTVYKTTDGGQNWTDLNQSYIGRISFPNSSTGYAICSPEFVPGPDITYYRVKKTTDGGITWTNALTYSVTNTAIAWYGFYNIQSPSPQVVYLTVWHEDYWNIPYIIESSVLRSTNGGATWSTIRNSNLYGSDSLKFTTFHFPSNDTGYVAGNVHPPVNSSYMLRYAGGVWTILCRFDGDIVNIYFPTNTTGYILTGSYNIYKTTNSGDNWLPVNPPGTTQLYGISFANSLTGYAVGANGLLLKTTTGGEIPVLYSVSGTVKYQDNSLPVTSGYVKALKYDSTTYEIITVDSAQIQSNGTYSFSKIPPSTIDIMAYENDEEELSFVPTYYVSTINWKNAAHVRVDSNISNIDISVKRTINSGNNLHVSGYIYSNSIFDNTALKDAVIYARLAGTFKGYSISLTNGYYCIDSLPAGVYEIIADRWGFDEDTYILSLTGSSLDNVNFYLDKNFVPVYHNGSNIPGKTGISQNYPNPFNPMTTIKFQVQKTGFAALTVYDISGRVIQTLVKSVLKPGTYEAEFDGAGLSSGVYFYVLNIGNFRETKKMILLK